MLRSREAIIGEDQGALPLPQSIVGLCVAKNESDIIEAMVRHNLCYLDALHVVDNDSADSTPDILDALATEFPGRLTWASDPRSGHVQTDIVNTTLAPLAHSTDACQIVLLDADEFLRGDRQLFTDTLRNSATPILLPWVTFVPTPDDDKSVPNPIARITHRRARESPQLCKTTVPRALIGQVTISAGNHKLKGPGAKPASVIEGLSLGHFPVRSKEQLTSKILIGAWSLRMRRRKGREGYHWLLLSERIRASEELTDSDLLTVALGYSGRAQLDFVREPLPLVAPPALKYTPTHNKNLWRNLVAFTERCVQLLEHKPANLS